MKLKRHKNYLLIFWFCFFGANIVFGQGGGGHSFDFLEMPASARESALGGANISVTDDDVNLLFSNPGLIAEGWHNRTAVNYINYLAGVSLGSVAHARKAGKTGVWAAGLQYLNLGTFVQTDASGAVEGEFTAREYFFTLGRSHKAGAFQFGADIKYAHSTIGGYSAGAVLFDLGGVFIHPRQEFSLALAVKNFGFVVDDYTGNPLSTPFDVEVGATVKPEHMPFRFSFTAHHLAYKRALYDGGQTAYNNDSPGNVDRILSHLTIGAEMLLSDNFNVRGGYNHMTNQEMKLANGSGGAGFSYGFMAKISAFEFSFSRAILHASGGASFFSLQTDLDSFFSKGK